jgi:hypothetical protein
MLKSESPGLASALQICVPHSYAGLKHFLLEKRHKRSRRVHEKMERDIRQDAKIGFETEEVTECPAFSMYPKMPYDGISPEVPERKESTKSNLRI